MTNADQFKARRLKRVAESYDEALGQLSAVMPTLAANGDLVALLFSAWITHAKVTGGTTLRRYCHFDWKLDMSTGLLEQFVVSCKAPDAPGDFIRVDRVMNPKEIFHGPAGVAELSAMLNDAMSNLNSKTNGVMAISLLMMGSEVIGELLDRRQDLVYFKEDQGLHLLFKDGASKDVYLRVYLGGGWKYKDGHVRDKS